MPKNFSYEDEFPDPSQKLATKFILDSLKRKKNAAAVRERETEDVQVEPQAPLIEVEAATGTELDYQPVPEQDAQPELELADEKAPPAEPLSAERLPALTFATDKKYYRIGEASEMLGVEPYVLRYWESEFTAIRPMKSRSGHRTYSRHDVMLFSQIRHLLYVEKYSVKGAKKKLLEKRKEEKKRPMVDGKEHKKVLSQLIGELKELVHLAGQDPGSF